MGVSKIPVVRLENLSQEDRDILEIGHYKFASECELDQAVLKEAFIELSKNTEFDCYQIGFEIAEFDNIIGDIQLCNGLDAEIMEEPDFTTNPVSRLNDTWLLDRHKLHNGSALDPASYSILFGKNK